MLTARALGAGCVNAGCNADNEQSCQQDRQNGAADRLGLIGTAERKAFLEEEKTENEEKPVEEVKETVEDEIEILSIDDEDDEEEDEILNTLDRYFEAPEPSDEEKKESDT